MSELIPWRDTIDGVVTGFEFAAHSLPGDLIAAMMMQESAGDPWATRFEPLFYEKYIKNNEGVKAMPGVSLATEQICRATSFGLLQVMGQVARELGFQGKYLTALCEPQVGLLWGCRQLAKFLKKYQSETDAIAAYNAGSSRKKAGGLTYVNQEYVDGVQAWRQRVVKEGIV